ncbi:MAG: AAA family ATPase [Acholeplasmataceae bacterium]|jgi:AAA15 family ATPase/GTPase
MLLKFTVENFKSFVDKVEFSMVPAPKQKDLEYSILSKKIQGKEYKALPSSVVYGPNASGKTNIIGAFEVFFAIVERGDIRNREFLSPNGSMYFLELIPNTKLTEPKPTTFSIEFLMNEKHVIYQLAIDLGLFQDYNYDRKVLLERLTINGKDEFIRKGKNVKIFDNKLVEIPKMLEQINKNLKDDELFFSNAYRTSFNGKLANEIMEHFKTKFDVVYRSDVIRMSRKMKEGQKYFHDEELTSVAHKIGSCGEKVVFVSRSDEEGASSLGVTIPNDKEKDYLIPAELIESYGTIRILNMFPIIKYTLLNGATLIVDEFDASLHPMIVMHIINLFHDDDINKNNAQLIFNTHNPIFLNNNLFRRDEIKFVEKENGNSIIYSLADFGTSGKNPVRNTDNYMKNYFINKYGAINEIDLTDLFASEVQR